MDKMNGLFPKKSILITGGGGYLGSKFLEKIYDTSSIFYIVDLRFNKLSSDLADNSANIKLINVDITNAFELERALVNIRPDLIFHFAALLDRSRDFSVYEKLYQVNVLGTLNLLEFFQSVPYECFYYAGTSEVYGSENPVPFHERLVPQPLSPYSLTKLMAENVIRTFSDIHQKPWVITRIFNYFGPDMPDNTFIPQLLNAWTNGKDFYMTPGEQKRDYLFIDDLIYYLVELARNSGFRNELVNICSGNSLSMSGIAETVRKLSNYKLNISTSLPYRENELWDNTGSNKKLLSLVPERTLLSFEEWVKELPIVSS